MMDVNKRREDWIVKKLIKNWIFTLVVCILLTVLAVLMVLDGLDVGGMRIGARFIHLLTAIALLLYVAFALIPLSVRYKGTLRAFALGEIGILVFTAVAQICTEWFRVPLFSSLAVCSVLGLTLWLRGTVETVHAYLSAADKKPKNRMPLWKLLLYILLSAVGVWQLIAPSVANRSFIFVIAIAAITIAVIFACTTAANYKLGEAGRKAKKKTKQEPPKGEEQKKTTQEPTQQLTAEQMNMDSEQQLLLPEKSTEESQ